MSVFNCCYGCKVWPEMTCTEFTDAHEFDKGGTKCVLQVEKGHRTVARVVAHPTRNRSVSGYATGTEHSPTAKPRQWSLTSPQPKTRPDVVAARV